MWLASTTGRGGRASHKYGTIIVDLERRAVVDVLARSFGGDHDKSGSGITRTWTWSASDRAGLYAEAAREGAPKAKQVADRFHLMQNFRETVERQLGGYEAADPGF